ncbi:MAG: glutamate synthase subunit beta [Clostridiales bacterium]|nr:glutamate synthase subunit beta [Clostridiales bacterium]
MGKPTGFMEFDRKLPKDRLPEERIKDWEEFHTHFDAEALREQGARCMNCGIPFCHTGKPVEGGCPLGNYIPEWNDLVYRGKYDEAYRRLSKTSNFPEFTGRVCPALCEGSCTLGMNEPPVTVKNIEVHIIDKMFEEGKVVPRIPKKSTQKRVAVVGSGPSGLACADILNQKGHTVTVFERADRAGGLLMYGIPNMKLDKEIVQRRIDILKKEGIKFEFNTEIGKNYSVSKLINEFDAVVLCCGATKARDLQAEGRKDAKGIYFAVDFLKANTKSLLDSELKDRKYISAEGKDVIIIGGGDTGTDCVGTAIRHNCKSVTQIEIMPEAPKARLSNNPWPQWPKIKKTDYGQEESFKVFGKDPREYLNTVTRVISDDSGNIKEVHTIQVEWVKENGKLVCKHIPGTEKVRPCQLLLLAMGFTGPEDTLIKQLSLETDQRSNVKAEYGRFETNVRGVFAAGDMRRGQSLVVWAIHEGREAAEACDKFLESI